MRDWQYKSLYNVEVFKKEAHHLMGNIESRADLKTVRENILERISKLFRSASHGKYPPAHQLIRMRDCSIILHNVFSERSQAISGFNAVKAVWDVVRGKPRPDLSSGFFAEMINWVRGIEGRANFQVFN